jgi:hypothetical protein
MRMHDVGSDGRDVSVKLPNAAKPATTKFLSAGKIRYKPRVQAAGIEQEVFNPAQIRDVRGYRVPHAALEALDDM